MKRAPREPGDGRTFLEHAYAARPPSPAAVIAVCSNAENDAGSSASCRGCKDEPGRSPASPGGDYGAAPPSPAAFVAVCSNAETDDVELSVPLQVNCEVKMDEAELKTEPVQADGEDSWLSATSAVKEETDDDLETADKYDVTVKEEIGYRKVKTEPAQVYEGWSLGEDSAERTVGDRSTETSVEVCHNVRYIKSKDVLTRVTNSILGSDSITNTGQMDYECAVCDYKCEAKSALVMHVAQTHRREEPCECSACRYTGSQSEGDSTKPQRKVEVTYVCSVCSYCCKTNSALIKHIRTHTGEKPFKCSVCEYRSVNKSDLNKHVRIHTGERPYQCAVCGCRSVNKSDLNKHIKTHTGEKPFECSICEYRCVNKSDLTKHMLTHTGAKPHKCSVCKYKSVNKSDLTKHMRTHTGAKRHKCSFCKYESLNKSDLKKHVRLTHT